MVELQKIATEQRNPNTMNIDTLSTLDMVKLINREDHRVAEAVALVTDKIAEAVDVIAARLSTGGRLIYCGAGTSGRLGILDAVECPPTYSTDPETVQALMAGGYGAIFKAVEGAEDSKELGKTDMQGIGFSGKDVLVGIAASGRTPYVLGCMEYAKELGLSPEQAEKLGSNFGGGMKCGGTCGVITSGLLVLGGKGIESAAKIGEFRRRIAENHDGMTDCKLLLKANAERGGNKKEHCDGMIREAITLIDELVSVSENKK